MFFHSQKKNYKNYQMKYFFLFFFFTEATKSQSKVVYYNYILRAKITYKNTILFFKFFFLLFFSCFYQSLFCAIHTEYGFHTDVTQEFLLLCSFLERKYKTSEQNILFLLPIMRDSPSVEKCISNETCSVKYSEEKMKHAHTLSIGFFSFYYSRDLINLQFLYLIQYRQLNNKY